MIVPLFTALFLLALIAAGWAAGRLGIEDTPYPDHLTALGRIHAETVRGNE